MVRGEMGRMRVAVAVGGVEVGMAVGQERTVVVVVVVGMEVKTWEVEVEAATRVCC